MRVGWGRRLPHSTRKPPGRDYLLPASSVRWPAQAGSVLIIFDAPIRRQGHQRQIGKRPRRGRAHHAAQHRPPTRLAATTDARTDQGAIANLADGQLSASRPKLLTFRPRQQPATPAFRQGSGLRQTHQQTVFGHMVLTLVSPVHLRRAVACCCCPPAASGNR